MIATRATRIMSRSQGALLIIATEAPSRHDRTKLARHLITVQTAGIMSSVQRALLIGFPPRFSEKRAISLDACSRDSLA